MLAVAALGLALTACEGPGRIAPAPPANTQAWRSAPDILSVERLDSGWRVSGRAAPETRVAFSADDQTFATSTDASGAFSLAIPHAAAPRALAVETRNGQAVARALQTLLLPPASSPGRATLVTPGGRSTVFGSPRLVESVDADGSTWIVSGAGPAQSEVSLSSPGRTAMATSVDQVGRWQVQAPAVATLIVRNGDALVEITPVFPNLAEDQALAYAADARGSGFAWRLPDGAVQKTWTPLDR